MKRSNKLLKISSIIYLIISLITIAYSPIYGGINLTLGISLLSYSFLPIEELKSKKIIILIISIVSIFINIIAAVLLFLVFDEISSNKNQNSIAPAIDNEISSENKRVDLLLKIGIGMIIISGILFATTSWDVIPDLVKCLGLILMGGIFLALSKFYETKIKILKTSKAYYCLGLLFFLLTWIGIGVFGVFSEWFSFAGEGKNLVYLGLFAILSIILFLINRKYNAKECIYLSYMCCYLCLYHILTFLGLELMITILIISAITLIINIFVKEENLLNVSKTLSYLYWIIIILESSESPSLLVILTSLINLANIVFLATKTNDNVDNVLNVIISYILITNMFFSLKIELLDIFIFSIATIFYLAIHFNKINANKITLYANQIIYNIVITITLLTMIGDSLKIAIFSVIYCIINLITCYILKKEVKFDLYYQPIIIFIVAASLFGLLDINITQIYPYIFTALIYAVINFVTKEERVKKLYFIVLTVMTILCSFIALFDKSIIAGIILIALAIYIYKKSKSIWAYIFILYTILVIEHIVIEHFLPNYITSFIVLLIYGALAYFIDDYKIRRINLIALVIPLYSVVNLLDFMEDIQSILFNIFALYILFLIVKLFIKEIKVKDIIATIGTSIIILNVIFNSSILIGIYVGIIGIGIIFLTYNKKDYKAFFYCGIVMTILNILIQLNYYWTIPFYLYLLVAGIAIIAFVTYREAKKQNQPTKIEQNETNEKLQVTNFCESCGTKNNGGKYCIKCGRYLVIEKNNS